MPVEIAVPHVPAELTPGTRTTVPVELHNPSGTAISLRLSVARGRAGDWASVAPATADLAPGGQATVEVVFDPPAGVAADAALLPFTVRVTDAVDDTRVGSATGLVRLSGQNDLTGTLSAEVGTAADGRPVPTVRADGATPARTGATVVLTVLAVLVAAGALIAWLAPDRLPFRDRPAAPPAGTAPGTVRRPYVMVDSRPQLAPADRAAAEATLAQLTAVGLPVRLVDSKTSDEIADGTNGFWVVLRDGFASAAEADAFCARYQGVTPQCEVVR